MTPKQAAFIDEYLIDHNGTQAAIRAGYSKRTARQQAVELLANAEVQQAIKDAETAAQQRNIITFDDLLSELEDARQLAKLEGQASAMVSATMAKAKMLGFDKPQASQTSSALSDLIDDLSERPLFNIVGVQPVTRIEIVAPDPLMN
jgi:phage terminase small subunit